MSGFARLSLESLETRETPSGLSSVVPVAGDGFYGTGVYKSTDAGKTWTVAPPVLATAGNTDTAAVRPRMFALVDRTPLVAVAPAAGDPYRGSHVLYQDITIPAGPGAADITAPVQVADAPPRFFHGFVNRFPAGR